MVRSVGEAFRRLREDAGLPQRVVAAAAGISQSHYAEVEAGTAEASLETICAIALALGGEASLKFFPGTGPRLRDRTQAAMVEGFLRELAPTWTSFVEVPVHRPASGVIDVVLTDRSAGVVVAAECQSQIRRLEQQLRWASAKADSLASTSLAALANVDASGVGRLLVLRSTRETRLLATEFERTLAAAYPGRARDAYAAVTTGSRWPGSAILWMIVERGGAKFINGPPRGVRLGR